MTSIFYGTDEGARWSWVWGFGGSVCTVYRYSLASKLLAGSPARGARHSHKLDTEARFLCCVLNARCDLQAESGACKTTSNKYYLRCFSVLFCKFCTGLFRRHVFAPRFKLSIKDREPTFLLCFIFWEKPQQRCPNLRVSQWKAGFRFGVAKWESSVCFTWLFPNTRTQFCVETSAKPGIYSQTVCLTLSRPTHESHSRCNA